MKNEYTEGLVCEDCGSVDAEDTTCPYAEEIYGEEDKVRLCDECISQRAIDI